METALTTNSLDCVMEENRRLKARFEAENEQLRLSLTLLASELRALQQRVAEVSKPSVAAVALSSSTVAAERCVSTSDCWTQTSPLEARDMACQHHDSDIFSPRNGSVLPLPPPTSERRPSLGASPLSDATAASKPAADVPSLAREADRLLSVISRLRSDRVTQRTDRSSGE